MEAPEYLLKSLPTLNKTITITGRPAGARVGINLFVNDDTQNIGFHFNPRFDRREIVMNSRVNGQWQSEQKARKEDFIWTPRSVAEFTLEVGPDAISCSWNRQKLDDCTFQHRVDASTYVGIQVTGLAAPQLDIKDNGDSSPVETVLDIKGDPYSEKNVRLSATIVNDRSSVNFKVDRNDNTFCLHFNPRFDQKVIVRNSKINGTWNKEEREMVVPFTWELNQQYEFDFFLGSEYFSCVWEGQEVCRFKHRIPPTKCVGLEVNGMYVHGSGSF